MRYTELKGKSVLITGGTQGIGEAIAHAFAREQAKVAINGRVRNEKVQKVLDATGGIGVMGSLSDTGRAKAIVRETIDAYGKLDIIIANAAGMSMKPLLEQDESEWWEQININLTGHIACIQEGVKAMKKTGGGVIVIIGSFFGTLGWKNASGYGASKSGILALGQYLDRQYRKDGIYTSVLVPGVIDTPQLSVDAQDLGISMDEVRAMYAGDIAMKRIGKPEEIADMTLMLCTHTGARALSGRHVMVCGGEYRSTPYYI